MNLIFEFLQLIAIITINFIKQNILIISIIFAFFTIDFIIWNLTKKSFYKNFVKLIKKILK